MIAYYFVTVCGCPKEYGWKQGVVNSVIKTIRDTFETPIVTNFEYILIGVLWHKNQGTTYTGERQLRNGVAFGWEALTDVKSIEAHISGDALEDGCILRKAWAFLVEHSR